MLARQLLTSILVICLIAGCGGGNQNVKGALPTQTPDFVGGAGAGAVAGAAGSGLINKNGGVLPGMIAGAMIGAAFGSYQDTEGLVKKLNKNGVNIIRIGDSTDIIIPLAFVFEGGETEVKYSAYRTLNDVAKFMKLYGKSPITVTTHTDNVDGMLHRLAISEKQAQSVTTYLWSQGINLSLMKFHGMSKLDSVADFWSSRGAGYNRRIQISIWEEDFHDPSPFNLLTANQNKECWKTDNPDVC